jgi:hypothetical protein
MMFMMMVLGFEHFSCKSGGRVLVIESDENQRAAHAEAARILKHKIRTRAVRDMHTLKLRTLKNGCIDVAKVMKRLGAPQPVDANSFQVLVVNAARSRSCATTEALYCSQLRFEPRMLCFCAFTKYSTESAATPSR